VYWGGIIAIRSAVWIPMWLLSVLWFPVALLPALGFALLAYRFPRVVNHRCRRCGWRQRIVLRPGRSTEVGTAGAEQGPAEDGGRKTN
jgi:hypothetical protein